MRARPAPGRPGAVDSASTTLRADSSLTRPCSPSGVDAGANRCVGCEKESIMREARAVLFGKGVAQKMRAAKNPYGDGKASGRIFDIIERFEGKMERWEEKVRS